MHFENHNDLKLISDFSRFSEAVVLGKGTVLRSSDERLKRWELTLCILKITTI